MEKSRKLTYDAFKSNWIEHGLFFRKSLSIFVERTFRPIATFAGGLFLLQLPVFLSVSGIGLYYSFKYFSLNQKFIFLVFRLFGLPIPYLLC